MTKEYRNQKFCMLQGCQETRNNLLEVLHDDRKMKFVKGIWSNLMILKLFFHFKSPY